MIKKAVAVLSLSVLAVCVAAFVRAQESSRRTRSAPTGTYERSALADRLRSTESRIPAAQPQPLSDAPAALEPTAAAPTAAPFSGAPEARALPVPQPVPDKQLATQKPAKALLPKPDKTPTTASPRPLPPSQPNTPLSSSVLVQDSPAKASPDLSQPPTATANTPTPAAPLPLQRPENNTPADSNQAPIALSPANDLSPPTSNPATMVPTPATPKIPTAPTIPQPQTAFRPLPATTPQPADRTSLAPMPASPAPMPASPAPTRHAPAPANQGPAYNTALLNRTENVLKNERPQPTVQPQPAAQPQPTAQPQPATPLSHGQLQTNANSLLQMTGPSLRVTTEGPPAIVVGKRSSYVIQVKNLGRVDAHEVKVRFRIPAGVRLDDLRATTGSAEDVSQDENSREFIWSVGKVAANRSEDIELQITPTENQPFTIETDWTLRSEAQLARIQVQQPVLELKIDGAREMLFGTTQVFTVVISNPGTGPAENVVVDLSAGNAQAGSKKIGTLAAGEKREMELELTPRDVGQMEIRARATGDSGLETDMLHAVAVRRAELNVAIKSPARKFAGSTGDYVVTITNTGDATAYNAIVDINLPRGAEYVSGSEALRKDGTLQVHAGDLTAGTAKTYELRCRFTQPGDVQLTATVQGENGLSATANAATTVEAIADLQLVVHDPRGPIPTGEEVTYELHITNRGTTAANDIRVIAQFSEGIEPTQAGGQAARLLDDGQVLFQPIRRLAQGESMVLKINAKAIQAGLHRFRAELTCKDPETRLVSEDSTKYFAND
ncbi:MAG: hypothetical protein CL681_08625 [Blastopirellula sp.]|nr:hypothetical protein [Blastopirellula sp.]